jgi:hypothetical protein
VVSWLGLVRIGSWKLFGYLWGVVSTLRLNALIVYANSYRPRTRTNLLYRESTALDLKPPH